MKHLKLFFALFAMLALGVGNAWGAEVTYTFNTDAGIAELGVTKPSVSAGTDLDADKSYVLGDVSMKVTHATTKTRIYNSIGKVDLRIYKSGGTLTFSVPSGSISKVVFAGTTTNVFTANVGTWSNSTWTGDAASVTFTATATGKINTITVTYETASGEDPGTGGETPEPDPDPTPDPEPEPESGTGGTGTINFNSNAVKINAASVTGDDNLGNTWTITTVGTTSYTANNAYYQVGKSTEPATSITFTTTLPSDVNVTAFSAKFGGFNSTAGNVTLKVDDTSVGTGSLNASNDVTVSNSSQATGKKLTVTVTGIAKGVKVYNISYTYTTSSGGSEPETPATELTNDLFAWSAATAEATMGASNTFPDLTNTLPVTVKYESSNTDTATIAADGTITLVAPGTTTISAKFAGGEVGSTTYAAKTVTYVLTVLKAPATPTENVYVKVTETAGITDGEYLIVYEDATSTPKAPVAFNGSLTTLDAAGNMMSVTITDNVINGNTEIDEVTFTISAMTGGYAIKSKSSKYIGRTSSGNGMNTGASEILNIITITDGKTTISGSGDGASTSLQYYSVSGSERFRYYGSNQKPIALYKKASKHTVTIADCTNGSVNAKMGETSLVTNDQVLSGTQITLGNEAATGYKLTAYDVYKTGDATTKVTENDGKFIMPEFDVTISATFELRSYEVSATPTEGGSVTGTGTFTHGATATLTATANTGYEFVNWTKDDVAVSTDAEYSFTVTEAVDLVANFEKLTYTVTATATEGGSVTGTGTFTHGTTATLTATANTGYTFVNWTKDDVAVSTDAEYSFEVTEAVGLVANFKLNTYTVTATATEGGSVTGTGTFTHGATATLTATANTGYTFVNWTKDDVAVSTDAEYSFPVTGAVELVANFLPTYTINVTTDDERGTIEGAGTYTQGAEVILFAKANLNYNFYQWRKKGEEDRYSKDNPLSFKATEDVELVADFVLVQRIVKVTAENGTVTAASGLVISKEASYPHGTVAKLTATPADHYVFVNWTKGEEVVSTEPTYTFTITEDVELVANFALDTHTVAVTAENGTVSGAGSYTHGTEVTLTATANTGYEFVNWTKGDEKVSTNATYTFIATEDITLAANFAPVVIPPTLVTPSVESGIFSVGAGKYVQFSTGNLQYEVGTNTWSFASEQYEVIGGAAYDPANPTNTNYGMNEPGYTGKLDLFGWSSDGKFGVNPSNADADYTDAFVDWGKLVDGEDWYTLTASEMHYLLSRKKDDKKLWATAELDGKVVLILLPDNWDTTTNLAYGYVPATGNFEENVLDIDTWKTLEKKGAVLLPSGGSRTGGYGNKIGFDGETEETDDTRLDANDYYFHVNNVGDYGYYWLNTPTSSEDCVDCAAYLITPGFIENDPTKTEDDQYTSPQVPSREKRRGNSVRLVKKIPAYTITATAENGTVTGAGVYVAGDKVTLTADPAMDYTFVNWTKGAEVVSTANPFVFEATENLDLVANFAEISQTSKTLTGEFSVGKYEVAQFATGNLQYQPSEGKWSFAKQQYQYVGEANINVGDTDYKGWIDMFGWSNGDANNFGANPSANKEDYAGDFVDWGKLFPVEDNWSTLTKDQWNYLLNQRGAGKKQIARVGTVFGVMLFPDVWTMPSGISVTAQYDSYFKVDVYNYTLDQWTKLENAGALFMPAAGRRFGGHGNTYRADGITDIGEEYKLQYCTNDFAAYWTSTKNDDGTKVNYLLNLGNKGAKYSTLELGWVEYGHAGHSVRLAKVTPLVVIGDGDNSKVIADNEGEKVNVKVNRTFTANNGYYTICLPFNIAASEIGKAYQIKTITEHVAGEGINIEFTEVTTLTAGQPYLLLPSKNLENPIFEGVTIVNTTDTAATTVSGAGIKVAFTGIINGGGKTNGTSEYYVGDNGYLYNGETPKLGLRAFFTITDEEGNPAKVRARVVVGENPTTGFENITTTDKAVKIIENGQLIIIRNGEKFNAQGQKL